MLKVVDVCSEAAIMNTSNQQTHKGHNMATQQQINRIQKLWSQYAGEEVTVEEIKGVFYGFGSELATLRVYRKYHGIKIRQAYSENRQSFYVSLEPTF